MTSRSNLLKKKGADEKSLNTERQGIKNNGQAKKTGKKEAVVPEQPEEPKPHYKRIYLYLHLESIDNLPDCENDLVLRLEHSKNTITKLVDHYTTNTDINLTEAAATKEPVPAFSIMIDQDSIEEMNEFSDNPVLFTLFKYIPSYTRPVQKIAEPDEEVEINSQPKSNKKKDLSKMTLVEYEMEVVAEEWIPKAQACIDMLQFFTTQRNLKELEVFMYPLSHEDTDFDKGTCKIVWKIYSLFPLINKVKYQNLVFLSLESIYNMKPNILDGGEPRLHVDLSFESKIPNEKKEFDKVKICSYRSYNVDIIDNQKPYLTWESVNLEGMKDINNIGTQFGCKLEIYKLLQNLMRTDGVDFYLEDIDSEVDSAMVYNSTHRYVLSSELSRILEDIVAFNQQHILLEFYRPEEPEKILLQGIIDLSIFLYPRVNAMRFAIELRPPGSPDKKDNKVNKTAKADSLTPKTPTPKGKHAKPRSIGDTADARLKEKPTFAIVNICLLTPLTENAEHIVNNSNNLMRKDQLNHCVASEPETVARTIQQIISETYFQYDELIGYLIDFIVRKGITNTLDHKNVLCCQLGNLVNKMVKLIAFDFNQRTKTKNNIEFTNLMTTVYKELEQRQYNILKNCVDNNLAKCYVPDEERQRKIIEMLTIAKYLDEAGYTEMGKLLHEKVIADNLNNSGLNFYTFLYDMEKMDFEAARTYVVRPIREKDKDGDYFSIIAGIYIDYMEKLQDAETAPEAFEFVLLKLRLFLDIYPLDIECWILLHCLYKSCSYLPGISYTRWKYENLANKPRHEMPNIPKSRWEIYNNYKLNLKSTKCKLFYTVFETFLLMGLYQFAESVFNEMVDELNEAEKYFIRTTFKILQNNVERKYATKQFPVEKMAQGHIVSAFQAQNNGNLEYYKNSKGAAMTQYAKIVDSNKLEEFSDFHLALLRYGYYMLEHGHYEKAIKAFEKSSRDSQIGLVSYMGLGRAKYLVGKLRDAEKYFAKSTNYEIHIPDAWAYLALINLKLGENFKALECWKYAKLNPNNVISDEILAELDAINYSDVNLYVDKPLPTKY